MKKQQKIPITPGPTDYSMCLKTLSKKGGLFKKFKKKEKENSRIGPGNYNIPATIPDVAKFNYPDMSKRKIKI